MMTKSIRFLKRWEVVIAQLHTEGLATCLRRGASSLRTGKKEALMSTAQKCGDRRTIRCPLERPYFSLWY